MWKSSRPALSWQDKRDRKMQDWFCAEDKGDVKRDSSGNIRPVRIVHNTIPKDLFVGRNRKLSEFEEVSK